MADKPFEKESLHEVERRMQGGKSAKKDTTVEGRHPDQQNRLKDQENLRK